MKINWPGLITGIMCGWILGFQLMADLCLLKTESEVSIGWPMYLVTVLNLVLAIIFNTERKIQ